ncbi:MAG: methylated-DNA--[protein]-cysteine S-methyltransferase [Bacteroidales bacterium]|nr:methylated-DNA--[protein]-cysteine S-methyltransferase [Bacteroidales bacterium]
MLPVFEAACRWLDIYFDGRDPGFTPPLNPSATPFRRRVWDVLLTIPFGQTMTYGEIARRLAEAAGTALGTGAISAKAPGSHRIWPRAVGGAVGHNPISLIIPCHRVIGTAGRLTGYAAGIDKKARLLRLEQSRQ